MGAKGQSARLGARNVGSIPAASAKKEKVGDEDELPPVMVLKRVLVHSLL